MSGPTERLCAEAKGGDASAASKLITLFYERIYAFLFRLSGHPENAADLTQKTFLKIWSSLASYEGRSSFSTWIHGIAYHVYADWRRVHSRTDCQTEAWWQNLAAAGRSPFENASERDLAHALYAAVEKLDEPTRQTVHLHYYQGLSLVETAQALEIAVSTVKYRLRAALDKLKKEIDPTHS